MSPYILAIPPLPGEKTTTLDLLTKKSPLPFVVLMR